MNMLAHEFDGSEGNSKIVTFKPVGPVARAFINDRIFISSIMGPYGSAKTTSCFQKILNAAIWQNPDSEGIRRIRVCVIRATYAQLQTNVMADWFSWFPKTDKNWNGEQMKHTVTIDLPGLGRLVIEMLFRALGDLKAEEVFKGMALTLLWLNEVDTLDMSVLKFGLPRVGRFPGSKDGGCAWSGIIADFNAPDVDNWVYDFLVNKDFGEDMADMVAQLREIYGPLFDISFHRQPGGREPNAENLDNLPAGYYQRMLIGLNDNEVRRFVDNEFGAVSNGQPVYPEYNDSFHCKTSGLAVLPGKPIHIGLDGGSTPAAVFGQEDEDGQIRVLGELVVMNPDATKQLAKLGPTSFARECRAFLDRNWPRARVGDVWGDPAMFYGGDDEDLSWAMLFGKEFKVKVKPAPAKGNRLTVRLETVRKCLTINVGSKPGIVIADSCRHLRRGFNNGYVIQRVKFSDGSGRWKDEPNKNDFSHVHDALQYLVCGLRKRGQVSDDLDARDDRRRARPTKVSYGKSYFAGGR